MIKILRSIIGTISGRKKAKKSLEYFVLTYSDPRALASEVNHEVKKGSELIGGPYTYTEHGKRWHCQAVLTPTYFPIDKPQAFWQKL